MHDPRLIPLKTMTSDILKVSGQGMEDVRRQGPELLPGSNLLPWGWGLGWSSSFLPFL